MRASGLLAMRLPKEDGTDWLDLEADIEKDGIPTRHWRLQANCVAAAEARRLAREGALLSPAGNPNVHFEGLTRLAKSLASRICEQKAWPTSEAVHVVLCSAGGPEAPGCRRKMSAR